MAGNAYAKLFTRCFNTITVIATPVLALLSADDRTSSETHDCNEQNPMRNWEIQRENCRVKLSFLLGRYIAYPVRR